MDITGIDVAFTVSLASSAGAFVKSLLSDKKTKAIEEDRVESKRGINERFAVLEEKQRNTDKRLDDGDVAFKTLDAKMDRNNELLNAKMDRNNELLNQLIGEVRAGGK